MAAKNRVTEAEIAIAVLRIAAEQPDGVATYDILREKIPSYVNLTEEDRTRSTTLPNEELWEQQIRNIKSHLKTSGNIICEVYATHFQDTGFKITDSGRHYLKSKVY